MKQFINFNLTLLIVAAALTLISCVPDFSVGNVSPRSTLKKFYEAAQKGDVAAVRDTLSRRVNERIDLLAANPAPEFQPQKLVETIRKFLPPQPPAMRDEKTSGTRGTLTVDALFTSDTNRKTRRTISFVKENLSWKIDDDIVFSAGSGGE